MLHIHNNYCVNTVNLVINLLLTVLIIIKIRAICEEITFVCLTKLVF